ncbi:ABC transporter ATP-binding protein [Arthrobacter sp. 4R501]|uniref:ABC transporter ATP-binding protein n=1 Tax=Arthrobacter sp. 4R501 TaxID=2058886 RepID=UPI000CE317FC|nr:ABC transporter ATP-binding protein [Arthrobacter sp. 4R501]
MITYKNIDVVFDDFHALPGFNLTIEAGEFFTLLGPSGCGKSTALRTLAGFIDPTAGDVYVDGARVTHLPSQRRQIGMVFQNYALFPTMTVRENIAFGLKVSGVSKAETTRRVDEIANAVELDSVQLGKGVTELSGGQQQRVAIARALVLRPKILLLDEPLSNLDAKLRHQLRGQLKELQEQFGITTVYVTHDQDEALTMSTRIAVMNKGRIEQVGTPQEVYMRSATEFVCNFIGDVNRLAAGTVAALSAYPYGTRGTAPLNPASPSYVRVEKVGLHAPAGNAYDGGARLTLPGTVRSRQYHGVYSSYRVELDVRDGGVAKGIIQESGHPGFAPGDRVDVSIDPADVLQYPAANAQEPVQTLQEQTLQAPIPAGASR